MQQPTSFAFPDMPTPPGPRPDMDIAEAITQLIRSYPPLQVSRQYILLEVHGGEVALRGNVRSLQAKRYLRDQVPRVTGVTSLNMKELYDDETVRLDIAEKLPYGIYINVQYGVASLSGALPKDLDQQTVFATIKTMPGLRHVIAQFSSVPALT